MQNHRYESGRRRPQPACCLADGAHRVASRRARLAGAGSRSQDSFVSETISQGTLGELIGSFMAELHRYDHGRTLPILHRSRMTTPQLATLEVLREVKTVSEVAGALGLSRPATSQMVDKLVRKKLVHRSKMSADRRRRSVVLSPQGRALLGDINRARTARFDDSLVSISGELRGRFRQVLAEIVDALRLRPAAGGAS
jgi:DNA-binding MarR family transcriptional regulator